MRDEELDLSEYPNRQPGSDHCYQHVEQATLAAQYDPIEAVRRIELGIQGFLGLDDREGEMRARAKAAIVYRYAGNLDRAELEANKAISYFRTAGDRNFEGVAALELGQIHEQRGELDRAEESYRQVLGSFGSPKRSEPENIARTRAFLQDNLANIYSNRHDYAAAIALRKKVIPVLESLLAYIDVVLVWVNLAQDQAQSDQLAAAEHSLEKAGEWGAKLEEEYGRHMPSEARYAAARGLVLEKQARATDDPEVSFDLLAKSRVHWQEAVTRFRQLGWDEKYVEAALILARLEIEWGNFSFPEDLLENCANVLAELQQSPSTIANNKTLNQLSERLERAKKNSRDRLYYNLPGGNEPPKHDD